MLLQPYVTDSPTRTNLSTPLRAELLRFMYRDVILQITLFEVCPDPIQISRIHLYTSPYLLDAGLIETF